MRLETPIVCITVPHVLLELDWHYLFAQSYGTSAFGAFSLSARADPDMRKRPLIKFGKNSRHAFRYSATSIIHRITVHYRRSALYTKWNILVPSCKKFSGSATEIDSQCVGEKICFWYSRFGISCQWTSWHHSVVAVSITVSQWTT